MVEEVVQAPTQPIFWLTARTVLLKLVVAVVIVAQADLVSCSLNTQLRWLLLTQLLTIRTLRLLVRRHLMGLIEVVMLLQRLRRILGRCCALVTALLVGTLRQMVREQRM